MRIIFAGTPLFSAQYLQLLIDTEQDIIGVYTQPDRPAGRGKKPQASHVKQLAVRHGLPVFQPLDFRNQLDREILASLNADLMIVVAYGLLLPQGVLDTPKQGCINVHASLLPRWRGAAPIQRAIEAGDTETGVTIMQMNAGLDTGDMLVKTRCSIEHRDTAADLHDKLIETGKPALLATIDQITTGKVTAEKQNDTLANYAHKIDKAEGAINWQQDAGTLDKKIRAFYPFPIAYSTINKQRIRIHRATVLETRSSGAAGQIIQSSPAGIDVQTGRGAIRIEQLQLPGKKALSCADILRGYPDLFTSGRLFDPPAGETH